MRTAHLLAALAALTVFSAQAADWLYLTVPGDTLSEIGQAYLKNPKDWPKIQSANNVSLPKRLPANSRLKIPVELLKVTPASVSVIAVKGNARFKRADGPFQPLKGGDVLNGGETVLTGLSASVSYQFADQTRLTQQAASKLSFGRLASYGKTGMVASEISLANGRLEASAAKQLAPAGGFRVHTPVAVAGLRGTGFRLNVAEDGKTMRNEVTEGAVAVAAQGQEVTVDAGFGTYAEQGKPPAPPITLLAKPDLSGLPGRIMRLPVNLAWPENASAKAWRVQLSDRADFLTILRDELIAQASVQWEADLPDGDYFLRIRGVDAFGLEGFNAEHAFSLSARPLPPMPVKPALGERIGQHTVDLLWHAAEGAQGYLLQLAPTPEFGQGMIERRLAASETLRETLRETLPSGEWHWRIASLDALGQPRAFSPHRAFRVQPPPAIPELLPQGEPMVTTQPEVKLQWQASAEALAYRIQIAADPDFGQTLADLRTTETQLATRSPAPGNWHWRVAALGVEDISQGFSKTGSWRYRPLPLQPDQLQARIEGGMLFATWSGQENTSYRLEISRNQDFTPLFSSHVVQGNKVNLPKPVAGKYWLRVIAVDKDKQESSPSPAVALDVQDDFKPWWLLLPFFLTSR